MRMKISQKRQARQRGNALVEFAICSVCLLLITIGVTDFARLLTTAQIAAGGAAAGTDYGSLSPAHYTDFTGMQDAALEDMGNLTGATATASQTCYCSIGGQPVTCPAESSCTSGSPETYITIRTTVPFTPSFSYPWMPAVSSVSSSTSRRVQ
jgi:Flp pilus assembly protein TadG